MCNPLYLTPPDHNVSGLVVRMLQAIPDSSISDLSTHLHRGHYAVAELGEAPEIVVEIIGTLT